MNEHGERAENLYRELLGNVYGAPPIPVGPPINDEMLKRRANLVADKLRKGVTVTTIMFGTHVQIVPQPKPPKGPRDDDESPPDEEGGGGGSGDREPLNPLPTGGAISTEVQVSAGISGGEEGHAHPTNRPYVGMLI